MDLDSLAAEHKAKKSCLRQVEALFPDIDLKYLGGLIDDHENDPSAVLNHIIDQEQGGDRYPRRQKSNKLKRKRDADEDEGDVGDFEEQLARAQRIHDRGLDVRLMSDSHITLIRRLLAPEFPTVRSKDLHRFILEHGPGIVPTYVALYNALHSEQGPPWTPKRRSSERNTAYLPENIENTIETASDNLKPLLRELQAARGLREMMDRNRLAEMQEKEMKKMQDEEDRRNFEEAAARGLLAECECCLDDFPLNRMVSCNGDVTHWFCTTCTRKQAETLVGLSKHEMTCMSMDDCSAVFSLSEQRKFMDTKLMDALARIEQDDCIRLACLEDLVTCPFCPFAAECPPIEVDKEFRCLNPSCEVVSCRSCKAETHIPLSCEENAKIDGLSLRRQIEEAMSAAMIRKCNRCQTPFIKESGCNKMTCTRSACRNMQCYVCSKSCDYAHFNDVGRGGKVGNCPLFDNIETRHSVEVQKAEEEARRQVAEENPDVDLELLNIKVSEKVLQDERQRLRRSAGHHFHRPGVGPAEMPQHLERLLAMNGLPRMDLAPAGGRLFPPAPAPVPLVRRSRRVNGGLAEVLPAGPVPQPGPAAVGQQVPNAQPFPAHVLMPAEVVALMDPAGRDRQHEILAAALEAGVGPDILPAHERARLDQHRFELERLYHLQQHARVDRQHAQLEQQRLQVAPQPPPAWLPPPRDPLLDVFNPDEMRRMLELGYIPGQPPQRGAGPPPPRLPPRAMPPIEALPRPPPDPLYQAYGEGFRRYGALDVNMLPFGVVMNDRNAGERARLDGLLPERQEDILAFKRSVVPVQGQQGR